jgi:DNA-binding MarR family transcriptional regulator
VRIGACADCGVEIVRPNGDKLPERCQKCNQEARRARYAGSEKRAELIRLYRAGVPLEEIAKRLGYASSSVDKALHRLRYRDGVDLGYRYDLDENRRRTTHAA